LVPILTVSIREEVDVVAARQRARQLASLIGFGNQDQVRIATAVSEIAATLINTAAAEWGLRWLWARAPRLSGLPLSTPDPASPTWMPFSVAGTAPPRVWVWASWAAAA
jgi:hypothetical protein